jgi:hypothetical protein
MVSIPTPIPKPLANLAKRLFTGTLPLIAWRLFLVVVAAVLLYVIVAGGPGFLVAFLITSVITAWYMDDILATLRAVWNANFYEITI